MNNIKFGSALSRMRLKRIFLVPSGEMWKKMELAFLILKLGTTIKITNPLQNKTPNGVLRDVMHRSY
jgi:hypothetical protein